MSDMPGTKSADLKYILVELADGNDPKVVRIFDTFGARARATREAILGPPDEHNKNLQCPEILAISVDGEGDPGLQWIDAIVEWDDAFNVGRRQGADEEAARIKTRTEMSGTPRPDVL